MCGALVVLCMRYGVLDKSPSRITAIWRLDRSNAATLLNLRPSKHFGIRPSLMHAGDSNDWWWLPSPSSSWADKGTLQDHDSMLVHTWLYLVSFFLVAKGVVSLLHRHPDRSSRPTFPQLVEMLSRADFELFVWEEEDLRNSDPQVKLIGAPLELAKNLYHELQSAYFSS